MERVFRVASEERIRSRFIVTGTVQGVGFRPFIYRIAAREGLGGFVLNDSRGVTIEVEGGAAAVDAFAEALVRELPPLATILSLERTGIAATGEAEFRIEKSEVLESRWALVTPDSATCSDCLGEVRDPRDRRHCYPFTNCTNCGPRYSIIEDIPYDRPNTTMKVFRMCADCQAEYDNPASRRFHAQPNACPACGPRLSVADGAGNPVETDDPVAFIADRLVAGDVAAIKGLGGFHLAVDATSEEAVRRLRERKRREEKAFAVMASDLEAARAMAETTPAAEEMLTSVRRPIVLLPRRPGAALAESVAPRSKYYGIMLPYTPLHHLLMEKAKRALVMTSGNVSEEPIAKDNAEAIARLGRIADWFLLHDREIHVRVEDSVVRVFEEWPYPARRSRGWAPFPVILKRASPVEVLAVGGELKNTITLLKGDRAYVSQHIGDLKNALAYENFEQSIRELERLLEVEPKVVAADLHPLYLSTRFADRLGLPVARVQHHHAHVASVMAENGAEGRVIGLSCDGTGYGEDKAVWGGEVLDASLADYRRLAHLRYVRLPGGDAATKEADRAAYAHLVDAFGGDAAMPGVAPLRRLPEGKRRLLRDMLARGLNSPFTSSLGRLFDAAAAIAGVQHESTYEGQPAIEFEGRAADGVSDAYPWGIEEGAGGFTIDTRPLIEALAREAAGGADEGLMSARFHNAVTEFLAASARRAREETSHTRVALCGGVFQNEYLLKRLAAALKADGFEVLVHRQVPTNDGGVSLGQAAAAAERARLGMLDVSHSKEMA
jgi:hydrogenase maturation protein HypF